MYRYEDSYWGGGGGGSWYCVLSEKCKKKKCRHMVAVAGCQKKKTINQTSTIRFK